MAYSTLFSMGFAFVPWKNFKISISIPHSTLKWKILLWTQSEEQATEEEAEEEEEHDDDEEDEEEDREEEGNKAKRRKA